jgi:hypothetical protein
MKRLFLLSLVAMAVLTVTSAYAVHPVFVNTPGFSVLPVDSLQAPQADVQLARWSPKCYCCWAGRHGKIWCKWTKVKRCWRTGGWCR